MNEHTNYITQALSHAKQNAVGTEGHVGAVLVLNGEVVSKGASNDPLDIHAEQNLLKDIDAKGATVYVTIQPSLYRTNPNTPSDSELLVNSGVTKLVVGSPNKKYSLEESTAFFAKHSVTFEVLQNTGLAEECLGLFVITGANQTPKLAALALILVPTMHSISYTLTNF